MNSARYINRQLGARHFTSRTGLQATVCTSVLQVSSIMRMLLAVIGLCLVAWGVEALDKEAFCRGVQRVDCPPSPYTTLVWAYDGSECHVFETCQVKGNIFPSDTECNAYVNHYCK